MTLITPSRRGLLLGIGATIVAPAIVRFKSIMPVRVYNEASLWLPCDGREFDEDDFPELAKHYDPTFWDDRAFDSTGRLVRFWPNREARRTRARMPDFRGGAGAPSYDFDFQYLVKAKGSFLDDTPVGTIILQHDGETIETLGRVDVMREVKL